MKFHVINLGCKVNRVESDSFFIKLASSGALSSSPVEADVIIVNTCTVTSVAEKKTRKTVRQALRANDFATVVVTGCASQQSPETYTSLSPRVNVVAKWDMDSFLEDISPCANEASNPYISDFGNTLDRVRFGVKVQDGCNNNCSYCIVHQLRGPEFSTPVEKVISDSVALSETGIGEIVLTGINLGNYDFNGIKLHELLKMLLEIKGEHRFRLSSIEPDDVTSELIEVVSNANGRICRHFHLPLQAGSSKVLEEMRRNYKAADYLQLVTDIRKMIPNVSISTDVIVGFPGESASEFEETLALCRECRFSKIHVFPYSRREGTDAALRKDQVPHDEKTRRATALRQLAQELRTADLNSRKGSREIAVVESKERATTESYHEVTPPASCAIGQLVEVAL